MIFDRGASAGWFESTEVWLYLGLAISGYWAFVVHCWTAENPFVDLKMFADRNFTSGLFFIFMIGITTFSGLALLPPLLQNLMGYSVIDTGIQANHPDLNVVGGVNYSGGNPNQWGDGNGHGTHVAGILAATTNNGIGVAGVAWEGVRLLPVKAFNNNGESSVELLAQGITYAADHGAHVINVSAGISFFSRTLQDAVRYALSRPQKPILVAASGNERSAGLAKTSSAGTVMSLA